MKDELDLSLEILVLLVLAVFMLLFGFLLFPIQTGALPYNPDATYGLFLVIVSFQVIAMGKTPFGDFRRSWLLVAIGIGAAILGMTACFIPGYLTGFARISVGLALLGGGLSLLVQLLAAEEKARTWMRIGGLLRQLTMACALVYMLTIILGEITLFPAVATGTQTAVLLVLYGAGFAYLSWCVWKVGRLHPSPAPAQGRDGGVSTKWFGIAREASLPLSVAILILLGTLLTLLGLLLFPVNLGLLAFSPDGQLGLLLTVMAIQMMSLGETPLGQFKRSGFLMIVGLVFVALGVVSSVVPGLLTGVIQIFLGLLNVFGGGVSLIQRYLSKGRAGGTTPIPARVAPGVRRVTAIQMALNGVAIVFGISTLAPGLVPGLLVAGVLVVNGLLVFILASALSTVIGGRSSREAPSV